MADDNLYVPPQGCSYPRDTNNNQDSKSQFRKSSTVYIYGVGGIIIDSRSNKLLVVKGPIKWSLPKGHLEDNESWIECAKREIKEETNITVNITACNRSINIKKCVYYIVVIDDRFREDVKSNDPEEIQDIQWMSIQQLKKLEANRQLEHVISRWDYIMSVVKEMKNRE